MIKEITEAPGYSITNTGKVLNRLGLELRPNKLVNGYLRVEITVNRQKVKMRIHRLVAQYFIPNPENKPQVNHLDGNKENNHYTNLAWVTNQENMLHAVRIGLITYDNLKVSGVYFGKQPNKPVNQLDMNNNIVNRFSTVREAKRKTGIQISGALSKRYKTAGGFKWEYAQAN